MNLDELRAVQSKERGTDSLQHLRESFYADAAEYISGLEGERDRRAEEATDPFADPEVRRLTDQIETAREVVEAIYERRLGKLVKRASLAAADIPADEEGLTAEERELFEDLVDRIEGNKDHVLEVLDGEADPAIETTGDGSVDGSAGVDAGSSAGPSPERGGDSKAPEERGSASDTIPPGSEGSGGTGGATADPGSDARYDDDRTPSDGNETSSEDEDPESDGGAAANTSREAVSRPDDSGGTTNDEDDGLGARTTVRVTGDVDEFFGVDERTYDLEPETVVSLPAENAEPLLQSGDAERVD